MKSKVNRAKEVSKYVWDNEWETVIVLVGVLASLAATSFSWRFLALQGLIFILAGFRVSKAALRADRLAREKHAPVVVVVGKREELADGSWKQFAEQVGERGFDADLYQTVFDVDRDELFLCHEDVLPPEPEVWHRLVREFRRNLERAEARLARGRHVFHVFLDCPDCLALSLGASLATTHEVVLYIRFVPEHAAGSGLCPGYGPGSFEADHSLQLAT